MNSRRVKHLMLAIGPLQQVVDHMNLPEAKSPTVETFGYDFETGSIWIRIHDDSFDEVPDNAVIPRVLPYYPVIKEDKV